MAPCYHRPPPSGSAPRDETADVFAEKVLPGGALLALAVALRPELALTIRGGAAPTAAGQRM
jgi:hypothetical protein